MRRFFASYRRRRRLAWLAVVAVLVAGGVLTFVEFRNTGKNYATPEYNTPSPVDKEPVPVPLTRRSRGSAMAVAAVFVQTAVMRRHIDRSWNLTGPDLRTGYTRKQWRSGDIPVVPVNPSDVATVRSRVAYSYANTVGLDILFVPKPHHGHPTMFNMELRRAAPGKHWIVDMWEPALRASLLPQNQGDNITSSGPPVHALSALWLFAPLSLVGLGLAVGLFVLIRSWYRRARAERGYQPRPIEGLTPRR